MGDERGKTKADQQGSKGHGGENGFEVKYAVRTLCHFSDVRLSDSHILWGHFLRNITAQGSGVTRPHGQDQDSSRGGNMTLHVYVREKYTESTSHHWKMHKDILTNTC